MSENSLVVRGAGPGIIRSFDDAERAAKAMAQSGFFADSKQAAQAIVKVLAGAELGFGPFASMVGISIIQGKPAIGANLLAALVKRSGRYDYRITKLDDTACTISFYQAENGKMAGIGESTFTMQDAHEAGLNSKENWRKYARNMLFSRAISNGVRWFCPDVLGGVLAYTPDEMGGVVDADGNFTGAMDGEVRHPEQPRAMTLEQARLFTTKGGRLYGDLSFDELQELRVKMTEYIQSGEGDATTRANVAQKLDAVNFLIDNAADGAVTEEME